MHWRPGGDEYIGDMIPFFWGDEYHIFYLKRRGGEPYPWCHIKSRDLVEWEVMPDVVHPSPDPAAPDARGCWTGCVVESGGTFYCFYTGWNPDRPHEGKYPQTICVATSRDLVEWEKVGDGPILWPDDRWYMPRAWRDPFVFYNEAAGEWWMVICARDAHAPQPRAGALALAASPDLERWEVREPLWSGGICYAPECPDIFAEAGRWYTVYSHGITRYRVADGPGGPWLAAAPDTLDGPHVRAAKSLSDGRRRLLFGWVPTREDDSDGGRLQWGGHMAVPRVLVPQADGALLPAMPEEIANEGDKDGERRPLENGELKTLRGRWTIGGGRAEASAPDGVALARIDAPQDFTLSMKLALDGPVADAGFLVRMSEAGDAGWKIGIERSNGRLALYRWESWGDPEPMISRPMRIEADESLTVHLICHGSIAEVFVDGAASLAARIYSPPEGWLGIWAANGGARIADLCLRPLEPLG